jgi:hypothetical protein
MGNIEIKEQLAEYAHEAWSRWMKYLFEKSIPYKPGEVQNYEGALIIPKWAVERWTYQINTEYKDLPKEMKKSDLKEADKILSILKK